MIVGHWKVAWWWQFECAGCRTLQSGIHKDSIAQYETALKSGKFIVIIHSSAEETDQAREIINRTNRSLWPNIHLETPAPMSVGGT